LEQHKQETIEKTNITESNRKPFLELIFEDLDEKITIPIMGVYPLVWDGQKQP